LKLQNTKAQRIIATPLDGENELKILIEMFASHMFEGINEDKKHLRKNGIWIADYKRIRVIGIKE